jgi:hypothetical protein
MPTLLAALDDTSLLVVILTGVAILVFLPSYIAFRRGHQNAPAILTLNIIVGLVAAGCAVYNWRDGGLLVLAVVWVIALIWSLLAQPEVEKGYRGRHRAREYYDPPPTPTAPPVATAAIMAFTCPHCASDVQVPYAIIGTAVVCPWCHGTFTAVADAL